MVGPVLIVILAYFFRDKFSPPVKCGDKDIRNPINIKNFATEYWAYSAEFEASIAERGKLSGKLNPMQLQAVSDASQQANEFRKFVVAGFNSCAITKSQYADFGARFQQLDSLSRQIDNLAALTNPTVSDKAGLIRLIDEYVALSHRLAKSSNK